MSSSNFIVSEMPTVGLLYKVKYPLGYFLPLQHISFITNIRRITNCSTNKYMKYRSKIQNLAASLVTIGALMGSYSATAAVLFTENFDTISGGTFNGGQFESNLDIAVGADLTDWAESGFNVTHIVDHANQNGAVVNPRNFGVMIIVDNIITLNAGINGSNVSGQNYMVNFLASPAVYLDGVQQTTASDGLLIELLRGDNSVLASSIHLPGAWAGTTTFNAGSFQFIGDGSGDLRFRVSSSAPSIGRFGGTIDDLTLSSVASVPEPSSAIFLSIGVLGVVVRRKRIN